MQSAVDQVSAVLSRVALSVSARMATLHAVFLWSAAYVVSLALMYLFHSPFRAHTACRTDWYAQLTKIMQMWLAAVVFFFHAGPQLFSADGGKGRGSSGSGAEDGEVALVFVPIFANLNMLFLLLHKVKRRFKLGVTFGPSFTVVLLNSILLAVFTMVHYAACFELTTILRVKHRNFKEASAAFWRSSDQGTSSAVRYHLAGSGFTAATAMARTVCPGTHILAHPFTTVAHLLLVDIVFIVLDYRYKAFRGFDPTRGILFCEHYNLRKDVAPAASADSPRRGSQRSVASRRLRKPKGDTAAGRSPHSAGHRPHTSRGAGDASKAERPCASAAAAADHTPTPASSWWWQWWWWYLTRNEAKMREAHRRYDFRYGEPTPVRTGELHNRHTRKAATGASAAAPDSSLSVPNGILSDGGSGGGGGGGGGGRERVSFGFSQAERAAVRAAAHPDGRSGMVPWFSTFILGTSWQTIAYESLAFLVFDVRILQETKRPKIFDLAFYHNVSDIAAARRQQRQRQESSGQAAQWQGETAAPTAAAVASSPNPSPTSRVALRSSMDSVAALDGSVAAPGAASGEDVWFDWIADIGDGFNSTYEMARLVAQPVLSLCDVGRWMASGSSVRRRGLWSSAAPPQRSASVGKSAVGHRRPRARPKTPPAFLSHSSLDVAPSPRARTPQNFSVTGESDQPLSRTITTTATSTANNSIVRSASSTLRGGATGAAGTRTPPALAMTSSDTNFAAAVSSLAGPAGRTASQNKYGVATKGFDYTLPRGSFLLVGGDLAYPNPSDETFLTRFIGPYNDALRSHRRLQDLYNECRDEVVEPDPSDADMAHIRMLDATVVSQIATRKKNPLGADRGTAEEALRSVPLLFSIPGNHEWLDGLSTFRKYILEKTWVGGWLVPQQTSYFVLKLPHNWFILCTDCGTAKDINPSQRNYFLDVVERYMNEESCVLLTSHEPGWIYDAMLRKDKAHQPELNRLALALGTRLRMWLSGDIHHYSRHTPRDPTSEAPTLVVSGSGGAFMHGPRRSTVIHQGTEYVRTTAFPHSNTYRTLASRLFAFRLINWKFDLIVGACCFLVVMSMLPQPYDTAGMVGIHDVGDFANAWTTLTGALIQHIFSKAIVSLVAVLAFFAGFSAAGAENGTPLLARAVHGAGWTSLVVLSCCGMLAYVECCIGYMANNGMLMSAKGQWGSALDEQVRMTTDAMLNHTRELLGESTRAAQLLGRVQHSFYGGGLARLCSLLLKCLDPVETLAYLSVQVSQPGLSMGKIAPAATRTEVALYYLNILFFYWILVTPLVSFLIGCFLFVCATFFDCLYDATYSAFQIEDYKGFLRLRIDAKTRELHVYAIAEQKVPKVWELDKDHVDEMTKLHNNARNRHIRGGGAAAAAYVPPPHLWTHPSRWRSSLSTDPEPDVTMPSAKTQQHSTAVRGKAEVLEHFVCRPHLVEGDASANSGGVSDVGQPARVIRS